MGMTIFNRFLDNLDDFRNSPERLKTLRLGVALLSLPLFIAFIAVASAESLQRGGDWIREDTWAVVILGTILVQGLIFEWAGRRLRRLEREMRAECEREAIAAAHARVTVQKAYEREGLGYDENGDGECDEDDLMDEAPEPGTAIYYVAVPLRI